MQIVIKYIHLTFLEEEDIGLIEIFQNIGRFLDFHFFEVVLFVLCIFLVSGIVDKTNETTNNTVIATKLQNVILESSNSPKEIVMYKFNVN